MTKTIGFEPGTESLCMVEWGAGEADESLLSCGEERLCRDTVICTEWLYVIRVVPRDIISPLAGRDFFVL